MCKGLETAARFSALQLYELSQFYAACIYMYVTALNMHNHVCNYIITIARRILKNQIHSALSQILCLYFQVIPRGADLLLNMGSALLDPQIFDEPLKFKPERFLSGDIETKKHHSIFFGLGELVRLDRLLIQYDLLLDPDCFCCQPLH